MMIMGGGWAVSANSEADPTIPVSSKSKPRGASVSVSSAGSTPNPQWPGPKWTQHESYNSDESTDNVYIASSP